MALITRSRVIGDPSRDTAPDPIAGAEAALERRRQALRHRQLT